MLKPKDMFKECSICPEMVVVPAGIFTMGSPESEPKRNSQEGPQHKVTFARNFAVGRFELTFDEWDACALPTAVVTATSRTVRAGVAGSGR